MEQLKKILRLTALICCLGSVTFVVSCKRERSDNYSSDDLKYAIMGKLTECSDLVVAEANIRTTPKIIIDNGNINANPATWSVDRLGEIAVILPVNVTIKYGYDLEKIQIDVDKDDDDSCRVRIYLPDIKIYDSSYDQDIPYKEMVVVKGTFQHNPSPGQISRGMEQEYKRVIDEFGGSLYADDMRKNTKVIFEGIINNLHYKIKSIKVLNLKDKH